MTHRESVPNLKLQFQVIKWNYKRFLDEELLKSSQLVEEEKKFEENNMRWQLVLQDLTNRSLNIEEEQEEVDDRAQTVEPELRRAIQNRNAKLESDLTAEWLALIQKRDNLLQQADKISKEKSRAKLELELIAIQFEARKIGLIAEYKKTQEHRDREFELANKCIALVQQKDQIDEEIDQIDANIISQQERHASQQQSFIDDQKRKAEEASSYGFGRIKNFMGFG